MAKTIETIINRFDGGIINDPRLRVNGAARQLTNFDAFTNRHKLTPYRDAEDGDSASSTSQKQNFAVASHGTASNTYRLYALGVVSGTGRAEILHKYLGTGVNTTDLDDDGWDNTSNNSYGVQANANNTSFDCFTYYERTGEIFGWRIGSSNAYVWAYNPATPAMDADSASNDFGTVSSVAEGLVHSKDDILYLPYDNKIAKNDNGSWTNAALTLPTHLKITSICEYGNYIAIAATPKSGVGKTHVYLWNRNSALATLSESIEWGTGELLVLEEIEGFLVGISRYGGTTIRHEDRIIFRYYTGGAPKEWMVLQADDSNTILKRGKAKVDERLYFMMKIVKDGTTYEGVWSIRAHEGRLALAHERTPRNDSTLDASGGALYSFIKVGDYLFQSFKDDASPAFYLFKTNNADSYTASSIFHTNINPNMPAKYMSVKKQLSAISLSYDALPTAGSVKLEYRVDGGSWVEIFTETTDSAVITEAKVDVNGDVFDEGREYEFKITSTGGAVVTELKYKTELMATIF